MVEGSPGRMNFSYISLKIKANGLHEKWQCNVNSDAWVILGEGNCLRWGEERGLKGLSTSVFPCQHFGSMFDSPAMQSQVGI